MRFLSPTTQKSADSLTYWQFFYYRPPVKFNVPWERSLKISCQELDIYWYYWYKQFDNRYGFSISTGNTKTNEYDLRAKRYPNISTHHKLHNNNNENKVPIFPECICNKQSGTKPNLVAKILATNFGVFFVIYVMFSKICSM